MPHQGVEGVGGRTPGRLSMRRPVLRPVAEISTTASPFTQGNGARRLLFDSSVSRWSVVHESGLLYTSFFPFSFPLSFFFNSSILFVNTTTDVFLP